MQMTACANLCLICCIFVAVFNLPCQVAAPSFGGFGFHIAGGKLHAVCRRTLSRLFVRVVWLELAQVSCGFAEGRRDDSTRV